MKTEERAKRRGGIKVYWKRIVLLTSAAFLLSGSVAMAEVSQREQQEKAKSAYEESAKQNKEVAKEATKELRRAAKATMGALIGGMVGGAAGAAAGAVAGYTSE